MYSKKINRKSCINSENREVICRFFKSKVINKPRGKDRKDEIRVQRPVN